MSVARRVYRAIRQGMIGSMIVSIALIVIGYLIGYAGRMAGPGNDALVWLGVAMFIAGLLHELMRPKKKTPTGGR